MQCKLRQNILQHSTSAVNIVLCSPCVGPLLRIKILKYLFYLSTFTDDVISAKNITKFLPKSPFDNEKLPRTSSEILIQNKNIYQDQDR